MQVITTLLIIAAASASMQAFGILSNTKIKVQSVVKVWSQHQVFRVCPGSEVDRCGPVEPPWSSCHFRGSLMVDVARDCSPRPR